MGGAASPATPSSLQSQQVLSFIGAPSESSWSQMPPSQQWPELGPLPQETTALRDSKDAASSSLRAGSQADVYLWTRANFMGKKRPRGLTHAARSQVLKRQS